MIRAVLDTNVLGSTILSPKGVPAKILTAWCNEEFDLLLSEAILEEIGRVFQYPKIAKRHQWTEEEMYTFLEDLASLAIWVPGELSLDVLEKDPSDNRFLECAFEGEADYLVTGDQDLLNVGQFQKITILTPREFLRVLREQKKG